MVHGPGVACGNAVLDWGFVQNEVFATIHAPEEFAAGAAVRPSLGQMWEAEVSSSLKKLLLLGFKINSFFNSLL